MNNFVVVIPFVKFDKNRMVFFTTMTSLAQSSDNCTENMKTVNKFSDYTS